MLNLKMVQLLNLNNLVFTSEEISGIKSFRIEPALDGMPELRIEFTKPKYVIEFVERYSKLEFTSEIEIKSSTYGISKCRLWRRTDKPDEYVIC